MIRRVNFAKAVWAGAAGAAAWELGARLLLALGLPFADLVRLLGTLVWPDSPAAYWWPAGLALHAGVGAIWAVFYAYFFWSTFDWRPPVQGLVFSLLPAALAVLIMLPQIEWMHPLFLGGDRALGGLAGLRHGWGQPAGIILGHLVYGAVMGTLYTHPVGSRIRRQKAVYG